MVCKSGLGGLTLPQLRLVLLLLLQLFVPPQLPSLQLLLQLLLLPLQLLLLLPVQLLLPAVPALAV